MIPTATPAPWTRRSTGRLVIVSAVMWAGMAASALAEDGAQPIGLPPSAAPNAITSGKLPAGHSLKEWSGTVAAHHPEAVWWALNDGGNLPQLFALTADGHEIGKIHILELNDDWEDIARAPGFLYVADIGDNNRKRHVVRIIEIPEPQDNPLPKTPVSPSRVWTLTYPDEAHDAEAFVVWKNRGWIIDKRVLGSQMWSFDLDGPVRQTLTNHGLCRLPGPILAADLSPDGAWLVVSHPLGLSLGAVIDGDLTTISPTVLPTTVPLGLNIQREAAAFARDGSSIFVGCEDRSWALVQFTDPITAQPSP